MTKLRAGKTLPVIFKQGKVEELEVVLSGNPDGGKIDFGVAQAILVRSQSMKKYLPDGLKEHPNIFSITGSKGLEFDDVLIFNFFTDSTVPAKVWRALSEYKDEEADNVEIPHTFEAFQTILKGRIGKHNIHPTEFSNTEHRALENELKDLYIAITRAKGNVWFFDVQEGSGTNSVDTFNASTMVSVFPVNKPPEQC